MSIRVSLISVLAVPPRGKGDAATRHAPTPTAWVCAALGFAGAAWVLVEIAWMAPHIRALRDPILDGLRSLRVSGSASGIAVQAAWLGLLTLATLLIYGGCGRPARPGTPPPRTSWGRLLAFCAVTLGVGLLLVFWKGQTIKQLCG